MLISIQAVVATISCQLINVLCLWVYKSSPAAPLMIVTIIDFAMTVVVIILFSFTRFGSTRTVEEWEEGRVDIDNATEEMKINASDLASRKKSVFSSKISKEGPQE